jgi:hypothetical protein
MAVGWCPEHGFVSDPRADRCPMVIRDWRDARYGRECGRALKPVNDCGAYER